MTSICNLINGMNIKDYYDKNSLIQNTYMGKFSNNQLEKLFGKCDHHKVYSIKIYGNMIASVRHNNNNIKVGLIKMYAHHLDKLLLTQPVSSLYYTSSQHFIDGVMSKDAF